MAFEETKRNTKGAGRVGFGRPRPSLEFASRKQAVAITVTVVKHWMVYSKQRLDKTTAKDDEKG
jgi:hypothetical protein